MATSPALEQIPAAKRADPYSDEKTIEELRANHKAGGAAIPAAGRHHVRNRQCERRAVGMDPGARRRYGPRLLVHTWRRLLSRFGGGNAFGGFRYFESKWNALPVY